MKYIFNTHVKVLDGFYMGQTGKLRQYVEPKPVPPKEGEEPKPPEPPMYSMEFDAFPGNAIWVKEDSVERIVDVETPNQSV